MEKIIQIDREEYNAQSRNHTVRMNLKSCS